MHGSLKRGYNQNGNYLLEEVYQGKLDIQRYSISDVKR
jgi:hypothetical protein